MDEGVPAKLSISLTMISDGILEYADNNTGGLNPKLEKIKRQILNLLSGNDLEIHHVDWVPQPRISELDNGEYGSRTSDTSNPEKLSQESSGRYPRPIRKRSSFSSGVNGNYTSAERIVEPWTLPTESEIDNKIKQTIIEEKRSRVLQKIKTRPAHRNDGNLLARDNWNALMEEERSGQSPDNSVAPGGEQEERGSQYDSDDSRLMNDSSIRSSAIRSTDYPNWSVYDEVILSVSGKSEGSVSRDSEKGIITHGENPLHGRARALSRLRQKNLDKFRKESIMESDIPSGL